MTSNWKVLNLTAVMALGVLAAPVFGQGATDGPQPDDKVLAAVKKEFDSREKSLADGFKKVQDAIEGITSTLEKVKADAEDAKIKAQAAGGRVDKFEERLSALEKQLAKISQSATNVRVMGYDEKLMLDDLKTRIGDLTKVISESQKPSLQPAMPTGRLVLVNSYFEEIRFIINGREVRVAPGMTQAMENVPAGFVNYVVVSPTYGERGRNAPALAPNETITLTVR